MWLPTSSLMLDRCLEVLVGYITNCVNWVHLASISVIRVKSKEIVSNDAWGGGPKNGPCPDLFFRSQYRKIGFNTKYMAKAVPGQLPLGKAAKRANPTLMWPIGPITRCTHFNPKGLKHRHMRITCIIFNSRMNSYIHEKIIEQLTLVKD